MTQQCRKELIAPSRELLGIIYWTRIRDNIDGKQIGEKVLLY